MPYMDDARTPMSIAVPFRASSLMPLSAPHAAFVLEKYFVAGSQCLSSRGDTSHDDLAAFNVHLYRWLQQTVGHIASLISPPDGTLPIYRNDPVGLYQKCILGSG